MSSDTPRAGLSRRTLVHGAAWSVPVVTFATATPAMAASPIIPVCLPAGTLFNSQGRGKLLSGTILGANLDTAVEVEGVHAFVNPTTPDSITENNTLTVTALNTITLPLTAPSRSLTDILSWTTGGPAVGLLNQHAFAHENGDVRGASGAVADNGDLATAPGGGWPELASLDLKEVLTHATGPDVSGLVASVTNLNLSIGAVAGRTKFNSLCNPPTPLDRDHLVAGLKVVADSPIVSTLATALNTPLSGLTVDSAALLGLLGLDGLASVTITTNTTALLAANIPAATGQPLAMNLGAGQVVVDVAALLGGPYTGTTSDWFNGLSPNTRLFTDAALPTGGVTALLDSWVDALIEVLKPLITINIKLGLATLLSVSLADLLTTNSLAGNVVLIALETLLGSAGTLNAVFDGVNTLLSQLFTVLEEVLVITVNAQNGPDVGGTMPADFAALPVDQYDVAALHLGVVGLANVLDLFLGRGSGGVNTVRV